RAEMIEEDERPDALRGQRRQQAADHEPAADVPHAWANEVCNGPGKSPSVGRSTIIDRMQTLRFDNRFVRELPADPEAGPRLRQVHGALYSLVEPTPVAAARLIAYSREVADMLGIEEGTINSPTFAQVFGGNALLDGMQPF